MSPSSQPRHIRQAQYPESAGYDHRSLGIAGLEGRPPDFFLIFFWCSQGIEMAVNGGLMDGYWMV
jgi:hypothetical protein